MFKINTFVKMTLVINYIEIENFKSYYGKNILGPFHQVNLSKNIT